MIENKKMNFKITFVVLFVLSTVAFSQNQTEQNRDLNRETIALRGSSIKGNMEIEGSPYLFEDKFLKHK